VLVSAIVAIADNFPGRGREIGFRVTPLKEAACIGRDNGKNVRVSKTADPGWYTVTSRALFLSIVVVASTSAATAQSCLPGASWCSGTYAYDGMGNIRAIGNDLYIYDTAGRLVSGTADKQRNPQSVSRQDYTYDAFGNRTSATRAPGSIDCLGGCELSPPIDTSTNHITGAQYDDAGNLTSIQNVVGSMTYTATYTYDTAGRLARAAAGTDVRDFIYTADDERIATANGATWTWTVRGLDGKVLREFTSMVQNGLPTANMQWAKDYVWRDGLLLASVTANPPGNLNNAITQHFHLDHLGTPRMVTGDTGNQLGIHAYYPFGAELNLGLNEQPYELMKFTGHERDVLANDPHTLDDMHARYYSPTVGRFLSVDPVLDLKRTMQNPQGWNRYSYVRNNPLRFTDPTGKYTCTGSVDQCKAVEANVDRVRQAAALLTAQHAPGASALSRSAAFYGKKDERNGVAVTVGDFHGSAAASTEKKNGLVIVTVDAGLLMGSGSSRQAAVEMAATFAHESEHGTRRLEGNDSGNVRSEVKNDEREAFRWGGYVNAAFGVDSVYHVWEHSAWNHSMLESWAEAGTVADCAAMGGCK
jgi:RHS repeat-associated protein